MKQTYALRLLALAAVLFANVHFLAAQSLQLLHMPGVTTSSPDVDAEAHIYVKNISSSTVSVVAKREQETLASGHQSYFCWTECYAPFVSVSEAVSVAPGDTIKLFKGYIAAGGVAGVSSVRYSFYNEANMNDSVQYNFVYDLAVLGTEEISKLISRPYPNPSTGLVSIDMQLPEGYSPKIELVNAIGRVVQRTEVVSGNSTVTFNTQNLAPGVYFMRTVNGNKVLRTQKFTVL